MTVDKDKKEEVFFDGEKVFCRRVDFLTEYAEAFKTADRYKKVSKVEAWQAKQHEEVSTSKDAMKNVAEPGDWIIKNPASKDSYVFGDKNDSIEIRQKKFADKYEPIEGESEYYRPKGVIKAIQVNENIVFNTPWGEQMAVRSGGWIAEEGYAMANFLENYKKVENE